MTLPAEQAYFFYNLCVESKISYLTMMSKVVQTIWPCIHFPRNNWGKHWFTKCCTVFPMYNLTSNITRLMRPFECLWRVWTTLQMFRDDSCFWCRMMSKSCLTSVFLSVYLVLICHSILKKKAYFYLFSFFPRKKQPNNYETNKQKNPK